MKLATVLSVLLGLMVTPALQAQPELPEGKSLFAAARKSSGFDAKGSAVKCVTSKGNLRVPPADAVFEFELMQTVTGKGKMRLVVNGQKSETLFDGASGWTAVADGEPIRAAVMDNYLMMLLLIPNGLDDANYFEVTETLGKTQWENLPCYEVECRKGKDAEMFCYFSIDTGLEVGRTAEIQSPSGPMEIQVLFQDYREVEGIRFPHKRAIRLPKQQELEVLSVVCSDTIDDPFLQRNK